MSSKRYGRKTMPTGPGFEKLLEFCKKARDDYGCAYAWSDTCCINKESSTELEEAIRSMYRWYKDAYVCIVHLAQTSSIKDFPSEPWFTRGWTLQELLAPRRLRLFGKDWRPICPEKEDLSGDGDEVDSFPYPNDKRSSFMLMAISQVTDIHVKHLHNTPLQSISVCERMRWASQRQTTRVEDVAYSLFGIFDISIPIAYGEGGRAFYRLMEAIVQRCTDPTLFAWAGERSPYSLALPSSPACYRRTVPGTVPGNYHPKSTFLRGLPPDIGDPSYTNTKLGLQVKLLVVPVRGHHSTGPPRCEFTPIDTALPHTITAFSRHISPDIDGYALGIVNYTATDETHGELHAGKYYFCMLLLRLWTHYTNYATLRLKIPTKNLLTFYSIVTFREKLETVCLSHNWVD
jgi:hypothetical protein